MGRNIFVFISPPFLFFFFFFHIFIHCHPVLSYDPNFKSLAHLEVSLKSITKFHPDWHTRKRININMMKNDVHFSSTNLKNLVYNNHTTPITCVVYIKFYQLNFSLLSLMESFFFESRVPSQEKLKPPFIIHLPTTFS